MNPFDRREFLAEVGQGMVAVLVGTGLVREMGLAAAAEAETKEVVPGGLDRLAGLLLETPPAKLLALFQDQLASGTSLRALVAGAALANARAFAGQDYEGYHTFMA